MAGKLYLCATPIGNLDDITLRVLNTLKEVDLIAAEDTRHSIKLLNHFDIKTPMTSYHEYNKVEKARYLVDKLREGTNIALITDAGTPGISDPGEELVKQCYEAGIELTSLPGPAACITALTISGMATRRFSFEAFLPPDKKEKQRILEDPFIRKAGHPVQLLLQPFYDRFMERVDCHFLPPWLMAFCISFKSTLPTSPYISRNITSDILDALGPNSSLMAAL